MLDNSLKSVLDDEKISKALRENITQKFGEKKRVYAIGDHCDIRKGHSKKLENIGKVRDLEGKITNGYTTLGSVIVDENRKDITLADISVFSNKEDRFVTQKELKDYESEKIEDKERESKIKELVESKEHINMTLSVREQTQRVSQALKAQNPELSVCHVHDRFCDSVEYFEHIDQTLNDEFVVRVKLSRNSNKTMVDSKGKEKAIKLIDSKSDNKKTYIIDKLRLKGKLYQQAKVLIEWDTLMLNSKEYSVVRITLKKKSGEAIHKKPMMLISNIKVDSYLGAKEIYHTYLLRSKIEAVFKFLKDVLGWEEFQVRDWESIKNIIAICFFIGGYFYEIKSELTNNETIVMICDLAKSKGKVTHYFFLEGLKTLLVAFRVDLFRKERGISDDLFKEMQSYAGIGVDM